MSKEYAIQAIAKSLGLDAERAGAVHDGLLTVLKKALQSRGGFELPDFGIVAATTAEYVPAGDLAEQVAMECDLDTPGALLLIRALIDEIKRDLLDSKRFELPGIGMFEFRVRKPKITRDATSGRKIIQPGEKQLLLRLQPPAAGTDLMVVRLLGSFLEFVKGMRTETVLIVLSHADRFSEILEFHFSQDGWRPQTATSVVDAVQKIRAGETFLLVIDHEVKKHQDLLRHVKFNPETALIPVIIVQPASFKRAGQTEIEILGDDEVKQPFDIKEFLDLSDKELERSAEEGLLFAQEVRLRIPSTEKDVDRTGQYIDELLKTAGMGEEGRDGLLNAYREAAGNSVRHGSRGNPQSPVHISYLLDKEKVTLMIRDEGPGFDWAPKLNAAKSVSAIEAARASRAQGKLGGLGMKVMLQFVDKLEYARNGSEIILTKYLNKN